MPVEERDAILSLSLSVLQTKLQSGDLKAVDVVRAYQAKVGWYHNLNMDTEQGSIFVSMQISFMIIIIVL